MLFIVLAITFFSVKGLFSKFTEIITWESLRRYFKYKQRFNLILTALYLFYF